MNLIPKQTLRLLPLLIIFVASQTQAQGPASLVDGLHPTSPTAWQFSKYTDLPVSEYTGIPSISVPLYDIDVDGVNVPLDLTYYGAGIKVSQDASWVGLGWDLQIGSIVQTVNNKDDFHTDGSDTQWLPDWTAIPVPTELPHRWNYPFQGPGNIGSGWFTPYPGSTADPVGTYHAFPIATDYYLPIGTNFDIRALTQFTSPTYDSEPDVFKANFLGYSINFMLDWSTHQLVVLNKKGYRVTRNGDDTWTILVPSGDEFDFTLESNIQSFSTDQIFNSQTSLSSLGNRVWMLTKIVTKNKKQILFNYNKSATAYFTYPSCSGKLHHSANTGTFTLSSGSIRAYPTTNPHPAGTQNYDAITTSSTQESYINLSSITFPNGSVNFFTSARTDMNGAVRLDSVAITTTSQLIGSYKFNYDYLVSTIGGNTFTVNPAQYSSTVTNSRLRLLSVKDISGGIYTFAYNSTPLPPKNSYGTDYWGYYNGQTSNTSMVPNAAQFSSVSSGYYSTLFGSNGNNHSANETYAQASILQQIKYPTGGTVNFTYELNSFNNYFVPDFSSNVNTVSHGNGLRVKTITYNQSDGTQSKKDQYSYSVGKAILPITIFRTFPMNVYTETNAGTPSGQVSGNSYSITELNMNGSFSPNLFGSITGIGYDTVSKQELDLSNNPKGKIVSIFYNNPDIISNTATSFSQLSATLPALKQPDKPDNGSINSQLIYDQSGTLLKQTSTSYSVSRSNLYYGARLFGYTNFIVYAYISNIYDNNYIYDQHLIGLYPLYDIESLPTSIVETNYFGTGNIVTTTTNSFDTYHQLASVTKTNSTYDEASSFTYPYNSGSNSVLTAMVSQNRLSDIITVNKSANGGSIYSLSRTYAQVGSLFLPSNDNINTHVSLGIGIPSITTYDQFDASNGNLLQTTKNSVTNSYIYDYNKEHVVAEIKNAPYNAVAYTSFESDGKGRWKFSGSPVVDNTAPTGGKDYSLSGGNIYRDSLTTTLTYVISYWSKNGAQSVNGSTTSTQGYTYNGWTYYEHTVVNPSTGTITLSGTGTIDELRLYPSTAQMATYTYEPLVGITSTSDAGGKISYYEYDSSKRLLDIRDQGKNILKAFGYNFAH